MYWGSEILPDTPLAWAMLVLFGVAVFWICWRTFKFTKGDPDA
jgi:hypothetical protein